MNKNDLLDMVSNDNPAEAAFHLDELESESEKDEVRLAIIDNMSHLPEWDVMDMEMFMSICNDVTDPGKCKKALKDHVPRMYNYVNLTEVLNTITENINDPELTKDILIQMLHMEASDAENEEQREAVIAKFMGIFEETAPEKYQNELQEYAQYLRKMDYE